MNLISSGKKITIRILVLLLIVGIINNCSENPTEQKDEPCPPIEIVANPAYNSPAWHPSGNFIGFNHTPLDSITYPYGENCVGRQYFNYDSTGFWLINIDGTNQHRILSFNLQTPAWSPDGKWIVFVLNNQIYKMPFDMNEMQFDTTQIIQLTFYGNNFFPSWSPDGDWITFDSDRESGYYRVWKMNNNGNNKEFITNGRMPSWSKDTNWIFYVGLYAEIFKVNVNDTSEIVQITTLNAENIYSTFNTTPKRNNNTLLSFISEKETEPPVLLILNLSDNNLEKLHAVWIDRIYSWSPNGKEIVYTKHDWNNWTMENGTLMIVNIEDKTIRELTYNK